MNYNTHKNTITSSKWNLNKHIKETHNRECDVNLTEHIKKVHKREGEGDCEICGKHLLTKNGMYYHMANEHKIIL
jgi:hypothetical protein